MRALVAVSLVSFGGCIPSVMVRSQFARAPSLPAAHPPIPPPQLSTIVLPVSIGKAAIARVIDDNELIPTQAEPQKIVYKQLEIDFQWKREQVKVDLENDLVKVTVPVDGKIAIGWKRLGKVDVPFKYDITIRAQPVFDPVNYGLRLEKAAVDLESEKDPQRRNLIAAIGRPLSFLLSKLHLPLKPLYQFAYRRFAGIVKLPLPGGTTCSSLRVKSVRSTQPRTRDDRIESTAAIDFEAGIEGDCRPIPDDNATLPPLQIVDSIAPQSTLKLPITIDYAVINNLIRGADVPPDPDQPRLELTRPELLADRGKLVIRLRARGFVKQGDIPLYLDGDLYIEGMPLAQDDVLTMSGLQVREIDDSLVKTILLGLFKGQLTKMIGQKLDENFKQAIAGLRKTLESGERLENGLGCVSAKLDHFRLEQPIVMESYLSTTMTLQLAETRIDFPCR